MSEKPPIKKLSEEADILREIRRKRFLEEAEPAPFPDWKKAVYLVFLLLLLIGSVYLLIFENTRQNMVQTISGIFGVAALQAENRTFDLPPPPPKSAEQNVVVQSGGPFFSSDNEFEGILYSTPGMDPTVDSGEDEEQPEFVAPPKSEGSETAFNILKSKSQTIRALLEGQLAGFEFQEWNPVQNKPPVFFIDVVALRSTDQQEVHLVWEVHIENENIRPLSQAARDLER